MIPKFFKILIAIAVSLKTSQSFTEIKNENLGFAQKIRYFMAHPYKNFAYDIYVDKYKVKKFVSNVIKTAEVYAYFAKDKEIETFDYNSLPDSFVIKATHSCHQDIFVTDKRKFNKNEAISKMKLWIKKKYLKYREMQYAQLTPGIVIEEYLGDNISVYSFDMFHGKLELLKIEFDHFIEMKVNYYDRDWNLLDLQRGPPNDRNPDNPLTKKPKNLDKLVDLAYKLTEKIGNPPYVRIDLYNINNVPYFSEYTFTPVYGSTQFKPYEAELYFGSLLHLPGE